MFHCPPVVLMVGCWAVFVNEVLVFLSSRCIGYTIESVVGFSIFKYIGKEVCIQQIKEEK